MRAKDIGGDDRSKIAAILIVVSAVGDVDHALRMSIGEIGLMGRSIVDQCLINRIRRFVGKNACGQA
jgi:hypothetical protein